MNRSHGTLFPTWKYKHCGYQETEYTYIYDVSNYKNTSSIQNSAQIKLFHVCHAGTDREYSYSSTQSQHQWGQHHDPANTQTKSEVCYSKWQFGPQKFGSNTRDILERLSEDILPATDYDYNKNNNSMPIHTREVLNTHGSKVKTHVRCTLYKWARQRIKTTPSGVSRYIKWSTLVYFLPLLEWVTKRTLTCKCLCWRKLPSFLLNSNSEY